MMGRLRKLLLVMGLAAATVMGVGADTASAHGDRTGTETGPASHELNQSTSQSANHDVSVSVVAAREPSPPGCDTGAFCAYERWPQNGYGALQLETQGNWVGGAGWVTFVFNNGVRWPGADHVQLGWVWGDGTIQETCVHYNPGPGHKISFGAPVIITRVFWRGEC
jgi:hypothetical protein